MLKKVNALLLGLMLILAFGCGEEDPAPAKPIQKSCLLIKEVKPGSTRDFFYNNAGQLVRVNFEFPIYNTYLKIFYNSSGNVTNIKYIDPSDSLQREYIYNADNLPDTVYFVRNSKKETYTKYEYNSDKKLIKRSEFGVGNATASSYNAISYPGPGQSKEMLYILDNTGNPVLESTTIKTYDDKKSPYTSLGFYYDQILVSGNNILTYASTDHSDGVTHTLTYSHNYNTEGYPVQTIAPPTVSIDFTYNCQ